MHWRVAYCSKLVLETWERRSSHYCILLVLTGFVRRDQSCMVIRESVNAVLVHMVAFVPFPYHYAPSVAVVKVCYLLHVWLLRYPSLAWQVMSLREYWHFFCSLYRRLRIAVRGWRTSLGQVVAGSPGMEWVWVAWPDIQRLSFSHETSRMRRNNRRMSNIYRKRYKERYRSRDMRRYTKGQRGR